MAMPDLFLFDFSPTLAVRGRVTANDLAYLVLRKKLMDLALLTGLSPSLTHACLLPLRLPYRWRIARGGTRRVRRVPAELLLGLVQTSGKSEQNLNGRLPASLVERFGLLARHCVNLMVIALPTFAARSHRYRSAQPTQRGACVAHKRA